MKWILLTGLWAGTLAASFLVGRSLTIEKPPERTAGGGGESEETLRAQVADLTRELESLRTVSEESDDAAGEAGGGEAGVAPAVRPAGVPEKLSLEGIQTARELSDRLMEFADAQLDRGPEGYREILKAIDMLAKNEKSLERLLGDEAAALRELYPWIRYMVNRESDMVDLTEYVFRSMAEEPQLYEGLDDNPLEVFTEGLAAILPGAVDGERLESFRGHARKILETPEEQQPEAIRKNRREIERALERYWAEPISPEKALEKLLAGDLDPARAAQILRTIPPEKLEGVDVNGLLGPLLAAGRWEAVQTLRNLPPGTADTAALDPQVLAGMESGVFNSWMVGEYLRGSGRAEWAKARPFFDAAFALGEMAQSIAADALGRLPVGLRPDKAYVEDVLLRYELPKNVSKTLKSRFGIE